MKYCIKCGKKLVKSKKQNLIQYDAETGKPIYTNYYECPTGLCNYTGIEHEPKSRWLGLFYDYKCKKCGSKYNVGCFL